MAQANKPSKKPGRAAAAPGQTFQEMILGLSRFWARHGCVLALPYDLEVGAGTMCPETFFRVLGQHPWRVAYVQPSRRPADGRYGDNPNRLLKHTQMQVVLKPPPADIQDLYLSSLKDLGIDLRHHDIRFEEDNWEAPTLGAWGIGWQVVLDGLEITQFTYFQQCGGVELEPISVELTYGLERIAAFLQNTGDVYQVRWSGTVTYEDMRRNEERELSVYDFEMADPGICRELFGLYEREATRLMLDLKAPVGMDDSQLPVGQTGSQLGRMQRELSAARLRRFPLRKVYEFCLKCSHLFNILDARGAISVAERVDLIDRVRKLACDVAGIYLDRQPAALEAQSA